MSTRDFIARTEAIGSLGAAWYFDPNTIATGKANGLDGFRLYFLGRAGVLGDVESDVVSSAFGYWNPELIDKMWTSAKAIMGARDGGRLYLRCCQDFGRAKFGAVEGLDAFCEAAGQVNDAINPAGLALYAGLAAEPLADDAPARAIQLVATLREARGSAHLVGVVASGLAPRMAHAVKRPDDGKLFGWEDTPEPTADDVARWEQAEELTQQQLERWFGVLDDKGQSALLAGLAGMSAAL